MDKLAMMPLQETPSIHERGEPPSHDSFTTLKDLVDHCDTCFSLGLAGQEKSDLVEYLKALPSDGEPDDHDPVIAIMAIRAQID
jgi:hypothetical protein